MCLTPAQNLVPSSFSVGSIGIKIPPVNIISVSSTQMWNQPDWTGGGVANQTDRLRQELLLGRKSGLKANPPENADLINFSLKAARANPKIAADRNFRPLQANTLIKVFG